jgi:hypothetical protein
MSVAVAEPDHHLVDDLGDGDGDADGSADKLAESLQRHRPDGFAHGPARLIQSAIVGDRDVVREPALTGRQRDNEGLPDRQGVEPVCGHHHTCPFRDCLNNGVHWPDTLSCAWREGPVVTEMIEPMTAQIDQQQFAQELMERARAEGVGLVGQVAFEMRPVTLGVVRSSACECVGIGHRDVPSLLRALPALRLDCASRDLCVDWIHLLDRR